MLAAFDLSTTLGISGQFDHPDFIAAQTKIEAAALAAGRPLGGVALAQAQAEALFSRGYRIVSGFDILWLRAAAAQTVQWCTSE